ncbi:hypothetical protein K4L05_14270 [Phaeobacter inhibens]|nr:hypothetical protein K4F85_07895 [Phaeobacter inhibens]UWR44593.1 hypothetical protein K4F86_14795 [Phaeobacter inhibens]UWR64051.1 hypothetical protein K4L02_15070 [Phaeobacter inhibens]UWR83888.1 hypothetical protein K4L05_14270 [Phaeobacter inhibens]UWR99645.1 hypothetical protein K4L03_14720 [Phaeobacter inhibens]
MGSLRGRVTCFAGFMTLFPAAAIAEVCDKARPFWKPGDGPATAWDELIGLSTLPVSLALLALAGIALTTRNRATFAIAAVFWAGIAFVVAVDRYENALDYVEASALAEGCLGPPHLFIGLAVAICAVMTYGALRPRT